MNSVTAAKCNWQHVLAALAKELSILQCCITAAGGDLDPSWFSAAYEYV